MEEVLFFSGLVGGERIGVILVDFVRILVVVLSVIFEGGNDIGGDVGENLGGYVLVI